MKIRSDYVTNSSSSSYVIAYKTLPEIDKETLAKYPFLKNYGKLIETVLFTEGDNDILLRKCIECIGRCVVILCTCSVKGSADLIPGTRVGGRGIGDRCGKGVTGNDGKDQRQHHQQRQQAGTYAFKRVFHDDSPCQILSLYSIAHNQKKWKRDFS